jgi:hypothetical protein
VRFVELACSDGSVRLHTTEEEAACLGVRRDALEQRESIADPVGSCGRQLRGIEKRVDGDDLLEQRRHNT